MFVSLGSFEVHFFLILLQAIQAEAFLAFLSPCSTSVVILKNSVSPDQFHQSRIQDDVKKFYGWIDQRQQRDQILTRQQICCYQSLSKYLHSKNKKIIQKFIARANIYMNTIKGAIKIVNFGELIKMINIRKYINYKGS